MRLGRLINVMRVSLYVINFSRTMKHDQFSYEAYKLFLKYLYTDELDTSAEIAFGKLITTFLNFYEYLINQACYLYCPY